MDLLGEIRRIKKEKNALVLAHNYQRGEVQDVADFVGDSLGLSQQAAKAQEDIIVFCGVHFMAETASIICPDKKVLIPDLDAGCSLAESITAERLSEWKSRFPDGVVVSYVNTSAAVKAMSDYCVTSSNAVQVAQAIPADKKILFLPDKFLGQYVRVMTGRAMEIWDGSCHVHEKIGEVSFAEKQEQYPQADFLIHPECGCSSSCMLKSQLYFDCKNIHLYSTEGMTKHVRASDKKDFVIATETGILHRLKKERPDANFYPLSEQAVCEYMKMITAQNLYDCLVKEQYEVKVPAAIAAKARLPIERMLAIA